MRTTLTIDDDVAATLERLRRGLRDMDSRPKLRKPFRTKSVDAGALLIPNIDNVAEVLAVVEGEAFK